LSVDFALIYAAVPKIACKGKCQHSCGPILATERERAHFEKQTGKLFPDSLQIMVDSLAGGSLDCPHLNPLGQCNVYQHRPLICRLWGAVPGMPCPHGCRPERLISDREAQRLFTLSE
jgi:Fe-S-cluster containining protein